MNVWSEFVTASLRLTLYFIHIQTLTETFEKAVVSLYNIQVSIDSSIFLKRPSVPPKIKICMYTQGK